MNNLVKAFEGISDSAASEYYTINAASVESVITYAQNGLDISLSDEDAQRVFAALKQNEIAVGTNNYDHIVLSLQNQL